MPTLPKELSPERCHQLREGGFLRVLVNLLHGHTSELPNKPEADFNIESFLMDFNRKTELRARSSKQLRTIVEHTVKNEDELRILGMLETLRKYIERLYNFTVGWKEMTEDPSKLSECTVQLTELAERANIVINELGLLTDDDATRSIFEQFGGVFVIVDYLRAQTRFNANRLRFESDQIDTSQVLRVVNDSWLVLRSPVTILYQLAIPIDSNDIRLFLGNSRSLHDVMLRIVKDAYDDGHTEFVQVYCHLLFHLYYTDSRTLSTGVRPSISHLKDCGVIKCLAKFGMEIKDPKTLYGVLQALQASLSLDHWNVLEFVSIDGSVNMLIDVLMPSKAEDEDVENAKSFKQQRGLSAGVLAFINAHLLTQNRIDGRLLAIYESRDLAPMLVHHLELITSFEPDIISTSIHVTSQITRCALALLNDILTSSEDQHRKFTEIVNGKEIVKRFESSDDELIARLSKQIGEMFE